MSERLVSSRDKGGMASMFNAISGRYDLMNRLMTAGQDGRWRRLTADAAGLRPGDSALDVATGTGDMALELLTRVKPGGRVVGVDIAEEMMEVARRKAGGSGLKMLLRDVQEMSFDNEFDAATAAFGFRNFADREAGLSAMIRALKPGGRLVILELVPAQGLLRSFAETYESKLLPFLGRFVSGNQEAYSYLPQSVAMSPPAEEIAAMFVRLGLREVAYRLLNLGTVAIVRGTKAGT